MLAIDSLSSHIFINSMLKMDHLQLFLSTSNCVSKCMIAIEEDNDDDADDGDSDSSSDECGTDSMRQPWWA